MATLALDDYVSSGCQRSLAQEPPPITERYRVVFTQDSASTLDSSAPADILAKDEQLLLPMLDLIENAQCAIDDLIDILGRATIEAVPVMGAAQLAEPNQHGGSLTTMSFTTAPGKDASRSRNANSASTSPDAVTRTPSRVIPA